MKSFYVDIRACVRVEMAARDLYPVNIGLRQGCEMSPMIVLYIYIWCDARDKC